MKLCISNVCSFKHHSRYQPHVRVGICFRGFDNNKNNLFTRYNQGLFLYSPSHFRSTIGTSLMVFTSFNLHTSTSDIQNVMMPYSNQKSTYKIEHCEQFIT